jgi:hypothetical protein
MMEEEAQATRKKRNRIRLKNRTQGTIANKVMRVNDKDYERMLEYGKVGQPLYLAFRKCLDEAAKARALSTASQRQERKERRGEERIDSLYNNDTQNILAATTKEIQIENNNGVESATGHHSNSTLTPQTDIHDDSTVVPDLTTATTTINQEDESLVESPKQTSS